MRQAGKLGEPLGAFTDGESLPKIAIYQLYDWGGLGDANLLVLGSVQLNLRDWQGDQHLLAKFCAKINRLQKRLF